MAVYRFKVSFEDEEVYRVIEVRSVQTFEDFHNAIQQSIRFDNSKPASFYMSDDYWRKGTEITLKEIASDDDDPKKKPKRLMKKSKMAEFIEDPHQKMLYIFDFEAQWSFTIELIKIIVDEDVAASYPQCIKTVGIAPKQYKPLVVPPVEEDDEEDDHHLQKEKIFQHEEAIDKGGDDDLEGEEGEADVPDEEEIEGSDHPEVDDL